MKDFYANMKSSEERKLERADYIGLVLIPRLALIFVVGFWTIGLLNYNYPGFSQVSPSDQKAELAKMLDLKVILFSLKLHTSMTLFLLFFNTSVIHVLKSMHCSQFF